MNPDHQSDDRPPSPALCPEPGQSSDPNNPRLIAFFLTQYHPIPENDEWWGKGFTEWTNVTKAKSLFKGHYQPHLPADLGFYDLRMRETRHEQVKLAKQYGIDGFCYYYYWFSGRRILHRPLEDMLADKDHDMPFCLCWANENWSRRWDAAEHEVLLAQKYMPEDSLEFIKSLDPYLRDPRYILKDGKPLIIVYRPQHLPDARETAAVWRQYCQEVGIGEIHICAALTHGNLDHQQFGFDSGVEFPPHNLESIWIQQQISFYEEFSGLVCQYKDLAELYLAREYEGSVYRGVFPSWDNTARRAHRSLIILNGTPANYEYWLASTIDRVKNDPLSRDFVFINAWNEWAEGCHLEPDRRWGRSFLESTRDVKKGMRRYHAFQDTVTPIKYVQPTPSFRADVYRVLRTHFRRKLHGTLPLRLRKSRFSRKLKALLLSGHSQ
ncbi:MAG: glycoside hydrolase family 99-like domain-containing protein [Synechococcaceae cyanobacterium]|jgi:lipopolysaccharide biosynthesis protein